MELIGKEKLKAHYHKTQGDDPEFVRLVDCIVDQQPVVARLSETRWVGTRISDMLTCAVCHKVYVDSWSLTWKDWNFCPVCGANIKGDDEDGE